LASVTAGTVADDKGTWRWQMFRIHLVSSNMAGWDIPYKFIVYSWEKMEKT